MKKQELIHLHGLLGEVSGYCKDQGIDPDLEDYRSLEVSPTSIQRSKTAHREAVFALANDINSSLDVESVETMTTGNHQK